MRSRFLSGAALAACFTALSFSSVMAATFSGMITVTRDASRQIVGAVLETNNRDGAGQPVTYNIVMDENGRAIAEQYENKDIKIDGMLNGKEIKADTWESVPDSSSDSSSSSYSEPSYDDSGSSDSDSGDNSDEEPADKDNSEEEDNDKEADDNDSEESSESNENSSDESESSED